MTAATLSASHAKPVFWARLTSDQSRGAAFAGRDHDKQLHDIVVDPAQSAKPLVLRRIGILAAPALHDENIFVADRLLYVDVSLLKCSDG